jgi:MFS family permease
MSSKFKDELAQINWTQFNWLAGLRRTPGIIILLVTGAMLHQVAAGVLAAATALLVGFAASRQLRGSRLLAMGVTVALMAICAVIGTLAGNNYAVTLAATAVGGFICGLLALASEDAGWIAMQGVIAFITGGYFAGLWTHALERAGCILIGGLTQIFCLLMIWRLEHISTFGDETALTAKRGSSTSKKWFSIFNDMTKSKVGLKFGLRVAITLALAVELDHLLKLKSGYWLPMTTLIVLKPDFTRTYTGGIQRVAGTITGVILASLVTHIFHPSNDILLALVIISAWGSFSFQKVNPVIFSAALTFFVVLLIALTGLPESTVTWHRLIYTFLGCVLALTSHFLGFFVIHRSAPQVAKRLGNPAAVKPDTNISH